MTEETVMQLAWRIYRADNWLNTPFDRRDFASALRSAHAIKRGQYAGKTVTEDERRQIAKGA